MDPRDRAQLRRAVQLSSTLWGGTYSPIVPLYRRMPRSWSQKPLPTPCWLAARDVILGHFSRGFLHVQRGDGLGLRVLVFLHP